MKLDALLREIVDAATRVHATLGPGFLESIYARALLSELRSRGLAIERERQIKIWYGSQVVGKHSLDLIVEDAVIVELKANQGLLAVHSANSAPISRRPIMAPVSSSISARPPFNGRCCTGQKSRKSWIKRRMFL